MPHFGLMDEQKLGPVEGLRRRAQLHLRSGKRRLNQGRIAAGIVTLYDAVMAAMEFYAARSDTKKLAVNPGEDLNDENVLYDVLVRSGVLDGAFDFGAFDRLMENALIRELPGYDYHALLKGVEGLMMKLEVMPFEESSLPPERPEQFLRRR
jgi:hypothetical protein